MKKLLYLTILLVIVLCAPTVVFSAVTLKGLSGSEKELKLYQLLDESKFVKAREIAEELLSLDSDSYAANYALGRIIRRAESNLPKAYYYLKRAKDSYERKHGKNGSDDNTWRWHLNILFELIFTAGEMELYEKQIEYLEAYDLAYIPKQTAYYAWPLMKLGRIKEAREKIRRAFLESKNEEDRIVAMNTLGSIESELDNREEAYLVFRDAKGKVRNKKGFVAVKRNFASSALVLFKYDEAEKEFINATAEGCEPYETSNPWQDLVLLYTMEGRFNEAYGAVRNMIQWGLQREPYLDQQCIGGEEGNKALFFLACGYPEQSFLITKRLVNRPDRLGYTSEKKERALGGIYLLHLVALDDYLQVLKEKSIWAGRRDKFKYLKTIKALEIERVFLKSRLKCITINSGALDPTLKPYCFQGISVPEYLEPDLTTIIGRGLVVAEINNIRKNYRYKNFAEPYLLQFEGELAYRWHDMEGAINKLKKAQEKLPQAEKLLLARNYAIVGKIEETRGNSDSALSYYQKAYRIYPGIFRHLGIRLPVSIRVRSEDPTLTRIHKFLKKSPRFIMKEGAFTVELEIIGNRIWGSLLDNLGSRVFSTFTVKTSDLQKDVGLFLDDFHLKAFSAPITASLTDINSLDGTNLEGDRMRGEIRNFFFEGRSPKDHSPKTDDK